MVVAAFRATLEELAESDILLHVIDMTHPKAPEQTDVVEGILKDLGLGERPRLLVMNKMDLMTQEPNRLDPVPRRGFGTAPAVVVSAAKGWNLDALLHEVESRLMEPVSGPGF